MIVGKPKEIFCGFPGILWPYQLHFSPLGRFIGSFPHKIRRLMMWMLSSLVPPHVPQISSHEVIQQLYGVPVLRQNFQGSENFHDVPFFTLKLVTEPEQEFSLLVCFPRLEIHYMRKVP